MEYLGFFCLSALWTWICLWAGKRIERRLVKPHKCDDSVFEPANLMKVNWRN